MSRLIKTARAVVAASVMALAVLWPPAALAQGTTGAPAPAGSQPPLPGAPAPLVFNITVVANTPLHGSDVPVDRIPAPVQTATSRDVDLSGALDVSNFLTRRFGAVHVNDVQGNPFQPDVNYRGYTASPLLGTPQGLSVYMDGVRLNQPFGDVVSWDLIPRQAIASIVLMPGSNPLFGLNTLGGALSVQTKNGRSDPGTMLQAIYGSHRRRALEFEHGGAKTAGLNWYLAGNLFDEDGWRDDSPSSVGQLFGKLGWQRPTTDVNVSVAYADNSLTGNGLQEARLLDHDYASVYTKPDTTDNRSTFVNLGGRRSLRDTLLFSGTAYYRRIRTNTLNGDINEDALDQEPGESFNGLITRTASRQHNAGASGQLTVSSTPSDAHNQLTVGAAIDRSAADFLQSAELGILNADHRVMGSGVEDTPVNLDGQSHTTSLYATDTLRIRAGWHVTLSGRFNRTVVENSDRITPGGGTGSLDGDHTFSRFNPAAGLTVDLPRRVNAYVGYGEGSRAATSIELGCADPESPCKLPNAMAGDPPLDQVVTRTVEAGLRGTQRVRWNIGVFRADNRDDILFVTSEQTGFGYFTNVGRTKRQGVEAGADGRFGRVRVGAGYTFLDATFQTSETVNGASNSANDAALDGEPGLDGAIEIEPGAAIPLIPRHMLKVFGELRVGSKATVALDVVSVSSSFARGNENNAHQPDEVYYLGPGGASGYAVVNLGVRYRVKRPVEILLQINNLFDRRYQTAAQLGPAGFTSAGAFNPRPLPSVNGEFPLQHGTFFAPGAPAAFWIGTRLTL